MTLKEIHEVLQQAFDAVAALHGQIDGVSPDTAFAIGEALGTLGKAKALLGHDIDQGQVDELRAYADREIRAGMGRQDSR